MINQTIAESYKEFFITINEINSRNENATASDDDSIIKYMVKQQKNDLIICIKNGKEIYNQTILDAVTLETFDYISYGNSKYNYSEYCFYNYGGSRYLIFKDFENENILFYELFDITRVYEKLELMAVLMLVLTVVCVAVVSLILYRLIKKSFEPLEQLKASAALIAGGNYESRIDVDDKQRDELTELAGDFNDMAEAVEQRSKKLYEEQRKKTLFMGNLTHELKTPMTAIMGYAETLLTTKLPREDAEDALAYIYSECGRLERLSHKMMQLLELENISEKHETTGIIEGGAIIKMDTPVSEIFDAAVFSCSKLISDKNIQLHINENGESFLMDVDLMTDVMVNLLDNAIKASNDGGSIYLISGTDDNGHTFIEVRDEGVGIPDEEKAKITEPFYMVDKSRSRKSGGAGLGLALVKLILEKHGLSLEIRDGERCGTIIRCSRVV
jgi:signal transduction histidine kinase